MQQTCPCREPFGEAAKFRSVTEAMSEVSWLSKARDTSTPQVGRQVRTHKRRTWLSGEAGRRESVAVLPLGGRCESRSGRQTISSETNQNKSMATGANQQCWHRPGKKAARSWTPPLVYSSSSSYSETGTQRLHDLSRPKMGPNRSRLVAPLNGVCAASNKVRPKFIRVSFFKKRAFGLHKKMVAGI